MTPEQPLCVLEFWILDLFRISIFGFSASRDEPCQAQR